MICQVIFFTITWFIVCKLGEGLGTGVLLAMLTEPCVSGLVEHEVLRLDHDEVAKEGCEEEGEDHRNNEREVIHDLSRHWIRQKYDWNQACFFDFSQLVLRDHHVNVQESHQNHQQQIDVL